MFWHFHLHTSSAPAVNTDYNLTPAAAPLQQPPTPKRNVQRQDSLLLPGAGELDKGGEDTIPSTHFYFF